MLRHLLVFVVLALTSGVVLSQSDDALVRTLRQEFLACGCMVSAVTMAQWKYATAFNQKIVEHLKASGDAASSPIASP